MLKTIDRELRRIGKNRKYLPKLTDYILFSSLSIIAGYTFTSHSLSFLQAVQITFFLPTIYTTNFLFMVFYQWLIKKFNSYFHSKYPSIDFNIVSNITDSHALLALMLVVYIVSRLFFNLFSELHLNYTTLSLIYLCTFLFFIRRVIKRRSPCHKNELECNQFSLLKYDAHKHIHMTSATIIAIPFLIGVSLANQQHDLSSIVVNAIVAYIIYLLTWMVLYQHKYKAEYMLRKQLLYFPSIFYPLYPILFSMYVKTDNVGFYITFILVGIIYAMPVIYRTRFRLCPLVKWFINEKYILAVIYCIVIVFSINNHFAPNANYADFKLNITTIVVAVVGIVIGAMGLFESKYSGKIKKDKEEIKYLTLPLLVLVVSHAILFGFYRFTIINKLSWFSVNNLRFLSHQLNACENIFVVTFALYVVYLFFINKTPLNGAQQLHSR